MSTKKSLHFYNIKSCVFIRFIYNRNYSSQILTFLSLNAFKTTETELKAIAVAATIGLKLMPAKLKTPAATGIRIVLYTKT